MIRKSFLTAFLLFAAYQVLLWVVQPVGNHTLRGLQGMIFADGNIIRAERYLYGTQQDSPVLLGSSLTQVLESSLPEPDIFSLAMPGMGVYDGLAVLERARSHPRLVLVEINMLQREPNKELLAEILSPELSWLRRYCSAARQEYQPANLFVPRLEAATRGSWVKPPERFTAQPLASDHHHQPGSDHGRIDAVEEDVDDAIRLLPELEARLKRIGSPVAFYQLPEYPEVTRSPALRRLREEIEKRFGEPVYMFPDTDYCTSDGAHLIFGDAFACSYYLKEYVHRRCGARPSP